MRYYISAHGSYCYDKSGITYPVKTPMDLEAILREHGAKDFRWEHQFGWRNQPPVLSFTHKALRFSRDFSDMNGAINSKLMISQHWRSVAAQKGGR